MGYELGQSVARSGEECPKSTQAAWQTASPCAGSGTQIRRSSMSCVRQTTRSGSHSRGLIGLGADSTALVVPVDGHVAGGGAPGPRPHTAFHTAETPFEFHTHRSRTAHQARERPRSQNAWSSGSSRRVCSPLSVRLANIATAIEAPGGTLPSPRRYRASWMRLAPQECLPFKVRAFIDLVVKSGAGSHELVPIHPAASRGVSRNGAKFPFGRTAARGK
jgi:hypothetical protein